MASSQVLVRGSSWFSRLKHRHHVIPPPPQLPDILLPLFGVNYSAYTGFGYARLLFMDLYYYVLSLHTLFLS